MSVAMRDTAQSLISKRLDVFGRDFAIFGHKLFQIVPVGLEKKKKAQRQRSHVLEKFKDQLEFGLCGLDIDESNNVGVFQLFEIGDFANGRGGNSFIGIFQSVE